MSAWLHKKNGLPVSVMIRTEGRKVYVSSSPSLLPFLHTNSLPELWGKLLYIPMAAWVVSGADSALIESFR